MAHVRSRLRATPGGRPALRHQIIAARASQLTVAAPRLVLGQLLALSSCHVPHAESRTIASLDTRRTVFDSRFSIIDGDETPVDPPSSPPFAAP